MMNQFARAKENGLNQDQSDKLNTIRFLEYSQKRAICDFIQELEDYFEEGE